MIEVDIEAIKQELKSFSPAGIYLFGSQVKGTSRHDSDVDVAFLPENECDPYDVFQVAQKLAGILGKDVDLVDLLKASTVMAFQVLKTGKRIDVQNPDAVRRFEMYTLSDYDRLNEERKPVLKKLAVAYG